MSLNHMIDHTMLKADASKETIIRYCNEAKEHEFRIRFVSIPAFGRWFFIKREAVAIPAAS